MSSTTPKKQGVHFLVLAILCGIGALFWMFYASDVVVVPYLRENWLRWFKVEWFRDTEWRTLPIYMAIAFGPMLALGVLCLWFAARYYYLNFATIHEANLLELGKAKSALQQSLVSVSTIEKEYKGKLESYQRLQKQLEDLQSVKEIDTEDLRRKLNAIAAASRTSVWFERGLGFLIGALSSLFASYVWERLHAI